MSTGDLHVTHLDILGKTNSNFGRKNHSLHIFSSGPLLTKMNKKNVKIKNIIKDFKDKTNDQNMCWTATCTFPQNLVLILVTVSEKHVL